MPSTNTSRIRRRVHRQRTPRSGTPSPDILSPDTLSPDTLSPDTLSPDTLSPGNRQGWHGREAVIFSILMVVTHKILVVTHTIWGASWEDDHNLAWWAQPTLQKITASRVCCLVMFCLLGVALGGDSRLSAEDERPHPLIGQALSNRLDQKLSATWDNADLRPALEQFSRQWQLAWILDRRLDPSLQFSLQATDLTVRDVYSRIAELGHGTAVVSGNCVYVGPPEKASRLRTLVALRTQELFDESGTVLQGRRFDLSKRHTVSWENLDTPREILERIGDQADLTVHHLDRIPHDLWAGAVLPQATVAEALSIVLLQFDLTFSWEEGGNAVALQPVPERVVISRAHRPPKGQKATTAARHWQSEFPDAEFRIDGAEVVVAASLEQHEAIEALRNPQTVNDKPAASANNTAPSLDQKRFTLRIREAPLSGLLRALEKDSGVKFEYNINDFKAAGIDLEQRASFEVRQATLDGLLQAAFKSRGIVHEIDGQTIRLSPRADR